MQADLLNTLCETGAQQLMRTEYLQAINTLQRAEQVAWDARDWDTLARLYLPLQEAHRQARQRCGEGAVAYDVFVGPGGFSSEAEVLAAYPMGQLLVSGPARVAPATALRQLAKEQRRYVETFLVARYEPTDAPPHLAVVPTDVPIPDAAPRPIAALHQELPPNSFLLNTATLPATIQRGTVDSYAQTMALWERLHRLPLSRAEAETDPFRRMELYREVLRIDPACELAHQKLAAVAREMGRTSS